MLNKNNIAMARLPHELKRLKVVHFHELNTRFNLQIMSQIHFIYDLGLWNSITLPSGSLMKKNFAHSNSTFSVISIP